MLLFVADVRGAVFRCVIFYCGYFICSLLFHGKEITETICACGGGVPRDDGPHPGVFQHIGDSAKLGTAAHGNQKTDLLGALVKYGTDVHRLDSMTPYDLQAAKEILDPELMSAFGYFHLNS